MTGLQTVEAPQWAAVACWMGVVLHGRGGGDELLSAWREAGYPTEPGMPGHPLEVVAAAQRAGLTGVTLVLPRAGDPTGLPGPGTLVREACAAGAAILLHDGGPRCVAVVPRPGRQVSVVAADPVAAVVGDWPTPRDVRRDLHEAVIAAAQQMDALSMRRPGAVPASLLAHVYSVLPPLPRGLGADRLDLLDRGLVLMAIADAASKQDPVSVRDAVGHAAVLSDLDRIGRRAVCSAATTAPLGATNSPLRPGR